MREAALKQMPAITGHRSVAAEVAHYTRAADQQWLARQAMGMQIGGRTRTRIVRPGTPAGQDRAQVMVLAQFLAVATPAGLEPATP